MSKPKIGEKTHKLNSVEVLEKVEADYAEKLAEVEKKYNDIRIKYLEALEAQTYYKNMVDPWRYAAIGSLIVGIASLGLCLAGVIG